MTHIRLYSYQGYWWLGLLVGSKVHLITRLGRLGSRIRP